MPSASEELKRHVVRHRCCSFWPCWGLLPRLFTCYCTLNRSDRKVFAFYRGWRPNESAECCALCEFGIQCDIKVGRVIELRIPRVTPPRTNSRRREWP